MAPVQQRHAAGRSRAGPAGTRSGLAGTGSGLAGTGSGLAGTRAGLAGTPVMAALGSAFNVLALNLVLLLVSLPVVTLPMAVNAAMTALDRWRGEGEDRVVREFLITLRSSRPGRTTAAVGVPIAAIGVGVAEARYFLRGGGLVSRAGLGLGLAALLITLTALGYVFLLAARHPGLPAAELWSLSARLAVRNLLVTGPLFLAEIAAAGGALLIDPPLLILGVPVLLLQLMRLTARLGLRRAGLDEAGLPSAPGAGGTVPARTGCGG